MQEGGIFLCANVIPLINTALPSSPSKSLFPHPLTGYQDINTTFYPAASVYPVPFAMGSLDLFYIFNLVPHFISLIETRISVMTQFSYHLSPPEVTFLAYGLRRSDPLPDLC